VPPDVIFPVTLAIPVEIDMVVDLVLVFPVPPSDIDAHDNVPVPTFSAIGFPEGLGNERAPVSVNVFPLSASVELFALVKVSVAALTLPLRVVVPPVLEYVKAPVVVKPETPCVAVPVRVIPELPAINVPLFIKSPVKDKLLLNVSFAPLLIVSVAQVTLPVVVILPAPVVAIITLSVDTGATPPSQLPPDDQTPPVAVLIIPFMLVPVTATFEFTPPPIFVMLPE